MTRVTETPYQTVNLEEYLKENNQDLMNKDTVLSTGLKRLRDDRSMSNDSSMSNEIKIIHHLDMARFSTESLHSFSFVTSDASMLESRQNILRRSIDFMKNKIKGWKIPVQQALFSSMEVTADHSKDIILPQEAGNDVDSSVSRKFKHALTNLPSLYTSINPASALHSPTRFTPQNQAIITTDSQSNILNANDIACLIFRYSRAEILSIKALDLIASPFREKQEKALASRPQDDHDCEAVLACVPISILGILKSGKFLLGIPIQRKNEETSAASLWLKVKKDEFGNSFFIWIFEEIIETTMTVEIDEKGIIQKSHGDVKALYGFSPEEIIGKCVTTLIPALETVRFNEADDTNIEDTVDLTTLYTRLDIDKINKIKFYGSRSKNGANFPIIGKISTQSIPEESQQENHSSIIYRLKIISIPTIAGVITTHSTGIIQSCNTDFVKYLFGVGAQELIGKRRIKSLLPQFPRFIEILSSERPLVEGIVISESAFRRAASMISVPQNDLLPYNHPKDFSSSTITGQGSSGIIAVHRDGTELDVDIQMRVVESPDEPLHALWITYDRNANFAKEQNDDNVYKPLVLPPADIPRKINNVNNEKANGDEDEKFPLSKFIEAGGKPMLSVGSSSVNGQISVPPLISPTPEYIDPNQYSAITLKKTVNDFKILDKLGAGAYGQVNLAYNKNDPEQKKVVLKYVVKSQILVDCWTRDKTLGTVPLEIHILHTLRRIPHPNIVQMVDYFEDDDYYYIEMGLHGVGMDLFDYIELNNAIPESEIKSIFRQVALAIQHLHHHGIVHRDIKDENVILDEYGNIQLIDFGSSAYIKPGRKYDTFCGTIDYAAPEVLTGKKYDGHPQDIWALGILLYTLIYKENPFYNIDEIIARDLRIPYIFSEGSIDLIKKMLDRDVDKRPKIDDVLNHPWLREN
ncbi:1919_t:CDS:2 [Diversispora eburnea]|uniref:non-specific serine/threonine protein kinase n=1 Tax=Diversispora eburnea TaxID=1213867 RepID=A0A9N8ZT74_9GLOM|nr:1919_t:CDS:2 [Diversispora eburnea]